ncbi:MAG: sulfatase-like hydrolase/transferase [Thermoanaerobaculia bacterium]
MKISRSLRIALVAAAIAALAACSRNVPETKTPAPPSVRPSILLVTLDTTRADSIGPEAKGVDTPAFDSLAAEGMRFRQAYATAPETLPSHTSMMTGLYPAAHGLHENARYLSSKEPLVAERLHQAGYATAAFISGFPLERQFGLARGFDHYDDTLGRGRNERSSKETTDLALRWLAQSPALPLFVWVHYYDPHFPYEPPEPFRSRYAGRPYLGEIAEMDQQMGRLVAAFRSRANGPVGVIVVGDHGEGLGDHGESQHGNLLYQTTIHVPLIVTGPGFRSAVSDTPVSTRRICQTILDFAGIDRSESLRNTKPEVVIAEAMAPFLQYGWQPQVMAVEGHRKYIEAGSLEIYDVVADPKETKDLAPDAAIPRDVRTAIREYPIPSPDQPAGNTDLSDEDRKQLASLGYIASEARPPLRKDAPRPIDMVGMFGELDEASALFGSASYAEVVPLFEKILRQDPNNLMVTLRLAVAESALGRNAAAIASFHRAEAIAPDSLDVKMYLALHYLRGGQPDRAAPLLEKVLAKTPDRLPAIEGLAAIREREGELDQAVDLYQRAFGMKSPDGAELVHLGELAMRVGNTPVALDAFERARTTEGSRFAHDLELGVLYLDARRLADARDALDRVTASDPGYPMALFKRAQVSVLLQEPDAASRIAIAKVHANAMTQQLIANERLFDRVQ